MLEIVLTPKNLGTHEIGYPWLKPFEPNGKSAPGHVSRMPNGRLMKQALQAKTGKANHGKVTQMSSKA